MSRMMTNDQVALIAAAIAEGDVSPLYVIGTAKKFGAALDAGLNPLLLSDDDDDET